MYEHLTESVHQYISIILTSSAHNDLLFQMFRPPHLLHKQRHLDQVKVLPIQFLILIQILLLHLPPGITLRARIALRGEQQLIDDNRMAINLVSAQLLNHALRFIQTQELRNTDTHKRRQIRILELLVHLSNRLPQRFHLGGDVVQALAVGEAAARAEEAGEHGAELAGETGELLEGFFHDGWELEEAEGVACGRGVEDDDFKVEGFDVFEDFGEGHGFVDTRDLEAGRGCVR